MFLPQKDESAKYTQIACSSFNSSVYEQEMPFVPAFSIYGALHI